MSQGNCCITNDPFYFLGAIWKSRMRQQLWHTMKVCHIICFLCEVIVLIKLIIEATYCISIVSFLFFLIVFVFAFYLYWLCNTMTLTPAFVNTCPELETIIQCIKLSNKPYKEIFWFELNICLWLSSWSMLSSRKWLHFFTICSASVLFNMTS